jgi:hypothetical protein
MFAETDTTAIEVALLHLLVFRRSVIDFVFDLNILCIEHIVFLLWRWRINFGEAESSRVAARQVRRASASPASWSCSADATRPANEDRCWPLSSL